jgi:nitroimidazol reductase NimA-like FMN-containing flavoprotein (pyridoxamine 5'-phosphate oxidase superfamily)
MAKDYNLTETPLNEGRIKEYSRDDAWIITFLEQEPVGHIATRWDDQPFITPSTFWYDPERHQIYFHSNIVGRIRANAERHQQVCFECSRAGKPLPSNLALEFSFQYASVIAFGKIQIMEGKAEQERALYGLIEKYFPGMEPGKEYRPITEQELARTSVYAIEIESWSGKENWKFEATQGEEWDPLPAEWLSRE